MIVKKSTGRCTCNSLSVGENCDKCRPGYWGISDTSSCQRCTCDPLGTASGMKSLSTFGDDDTQVQEMGYVCDATSGQCDCRVNRVGRDCGTCADGFFLLNLSGIDCQACICDPFGTVPGTTCNPNTGECTCKLANGIGGTRCDECDLGYYNFSRITGS